MSQYLVLSHIDIQNANSIAGLTWGFPALTSFLGFTHALNRKLSSAYEGEYSFELAGCAVISHTINNKVYQPKKYADFEFLQSKNPPVLAKHKNASPPIIEEGKINLSVSLVIELNQAMSLSTEDIKAFEKAALGTCLRMRLAGGTILNIKQAKLLSASTQSQHIDMLRKVKRLTLPGFVLLDRSDYLQNHYRSLLSAHLANKSSTAEPQLLDAWLEFAAFKSMSTPQFENQQTIADENTPATWERISKPNPGYLVPLMTGYKAISELYAAGEVSNTRDEITPACFVEAIHSIGEWSGVHNIKNLQHTIWRCKHDEQWYLCQQDHDSIIDVEDEINADTSEIQTLNFNEALNLF
jgi:CRISPR-associated protein Csy2